MLAPHQFHMLSYSQHELTTDDRRVIRCRCQYDVCYFLLYLSLILTLGEMRLSVLYVMHGI